MSTLPKPFNYKSLLRSAARRIDLWSPMRKEAIRNARVAKGIVGCAECRVRMKEYAPEKEYQVDHTVPASEPAALIHDWNDFFARLFVSASGRRVLCKPCHQAKTNDENKVRRNKPRAKRRRVKHGK